MKSAKLEAIQQVQEIKKKALERWIVETIEPITEQIEKDSREIFNKVYTKVRKLEEEVDTWA